MNQSFEVRYACDPRNFPSYDSSRIRNDFLIRELFQPNHLHWVYTHYDRYLIGSAVPQGEILSLESIPPLKADYFLERRELGVINIGGVGVVRVEGQAYELGYKEALYMGKGNRQVTFSSQDAGRPAKFYLNSTPAHAAFPTVKISSKEAEIVELGSMEGSNARTIRKLIVHSLVKTNQLQMGMTELKVGSVWNTMPAHTHDRRMEVYLYLEVPEEEAVCHFMGQPQETRHIWVHNEEAVISPPWSIHCGSGTHNYTFIWGMAGENLDYGDMDPVAPIDLR